MKLVYLALLFAALTASATEPCARNRVLLITDSHGLTPFGEYLEDWLLTVPDTEINTYALGGASPMWWFHSYTTPRGFVFNSCYPKTRLNRRTLQARKVPSPGLAATLASHADAYEHQTVIVAFGSNVPGPTSLYEFETERFVRAIKEHPNTTCIWIAPPNMRKREKNYMAKVYAAIETGIKKASPTSGEPACVLIDSRKYGFYPEHDGDGIHYPYTSEGMAAAHTWVAGILTELQPLLKAK